MKKNIKISLEQYKMLCEVDSDNFSQIITDDPIEPYHALSQISADGYKDDEDYADTKTTSDTDAAKKTPQGYVRYQRLGNSHYAHLMESDADDIGDTDDYAKYNRLGNYGAMAHGGIREVKIKNPQSEQNPDFYDTGVIPDDNIDILSNGNPDDNLVVIPQDVQHKIDLLINIVKQNNLKPKQQAIVLNKMIEELDTENIPYQWKKILMDKLK